MIVAEDTDYEYEIIPHGERRDVQLQLHIFGFGW
jgi:hypothetical protein